MSSETKKGSNTTVRLVILGVLLGVVGLVWWDQQGLKQCRAAADTLLNVIDDATVPRTPEWVHELIKKEPTSTDEYMESATRTRFFVEKFEWPGIGRSHALYVSYTVGATKLFHAYSIGRPFPGTAEGGGAASLPQATTPPSGQGETDEPGGAAGSDASSDSSASSDTNTATDAAGSADSGNAAESSTPAETGAAAQ